MLASKSPFTPGLSSGGLPTSVPQTALPTSRRTPVVPSSTQNYGSPTESEFSDSDGPDSVKNWDEERVCEYLRSVKCGEYVQTFRKNHINGENLLEMDKEVLKEMGIDKVGDRVRLFLGIKKLRTRAYANQKKRNRVNNQLRNTAFSESEFANSWRVLGFLCCFGNSHGRATLGITTTPDKPPDAEQQRCKQTILKAD